MTRKINIILFGIGNTGSALINKVLKERKNLILEQQLDIRFAVITNSTVAFYEKEGANFSWEANFIQFAIPFKMEDVLHYVYNNNLENIIAVDATDSTQLAADYIQLIRSGFSIVSINETLAFLPDSFEKGIRFLAESQGVSHKFVTAAGRNKEAAADALFEGVMEMVEKQKVLV